MKIDKYNSVKWWEKKRLIYNLVLIITLVIINLKHSTSTQELSLIDSIIWLIGANAFYSLSWLFEYLTAIIGRKKVPDKIRIWLFIIGTFLSAVWTDLNL